MNRKSLRFICGGLLGFATLGFRGIKSHERSPLPFSSKAIHSPSASIEAETEFEKEFALEAASEKPSKPAMEWPVLAPEASFHQRVVWENLNSTKMESTADRVFFGEDYEKRRSSYSLSEFARSAKNWKFAATDFVQVELPDQTTLRMRFTFNQSSCVENIHRRTPSDYSMCISELSFSVNGDTVILIDALEASTLATNGYHYAALSVPDLTHKEFQFAGVRFFLPLPRSDAQDAQKLTAILYLDPDGRQQIPVDVIWHKLDKSPVRGDGM